MAAPHLLAGVASLGAFGCEGTVTTPSVRGGDGSTTPGGSGIPALDGQSPDAVLASAECQSPQPGRAPMRRLSNFEYANTVKDLFANVSGMAAVVDDAVATFPAESESLGFRNNADFLAVGSLVAQNYLDAAESIAEKAAQATGFLPCDPASDGELACAQTFIDTFGAKVYRRALTDAEQQTYEDLYTKAATDYDFQTGIEWIVFSMLQSMPFLYRVELGRDSSGAYTQPTPNEMAARLSYLIWQSAPDSELLEAAEGGQLETPKQLEDQARRLLADPKSSRLLQYFEQWLDTDSLESLQRDADVYPNLNPDLGSLLQRETDAFVGQLLASGGSFEELVTAQYTYANSALAAHYGLSGVTGDDFVKVDAPGRSGVLTQGMLLVHDKQTRTSIVRRGLKIRTDVLCELVPAPPPNVLTNLEAVGTDLSQRDRLELHRTESSCAGCHQLMDPIGVVFESFDAVGRFRTVDESGKPVDTSSTIAQTDDIDGDVANASELGQKLAQSAEAQACYVLQNFRYFYGRDSTDADKCSMAQLLKAFDGNQHSLSELVVALTQTDAFRYRPVVVPEASP